MLKKFFLFTTVLLASIICLSPAFSQENLGHRLERDLLDREELFDELLVVRICPDPEDQGKTRVEFLHNLKRLEGFGIRVKSARLNGEPLRLRDKKKVNGEKQPFTSVCEHRSNPTDPLVEVAFIKPSDEVRLMKLNLTGSRNTSVGAQSNLPVVIPPEGEVLDLVFDWSGSEQRYHLHNALME